VRIPLYQVDAFTRRRFHGNPAAVCPLDEPLDDGILQKVAAENNLSETAFLVSRANYHELRWFTPRCEVELCGHATLASAHVLLNLLQPELRQARFETRFKGTLTVKKADGEDGLLAMDFPAMPTRNCENPPPELLRGLASDPARILETNRIYLCVFDSRRSVEAVRPDFSLLERLHPFSVGITAPDREVDFVSRYFAPSYGIPEDPVTGSLHCALAPYWAGRLGKTNLHAHQLSERGGELWCEVKGDRVTLKGHAVLTVEGTLHI
jgi:predicted PhzF superfamily epimerase YddE/YHI9